MTDDLVITNYVYEHVEDNTRNVVDYRRVLPVGKVFTWGQIGHFKMSQYLLMHALTYRTETLRAAKLQMPAHTFYVDNIYAYVPFPLCHSLYCLMRYRNIYFYPLHIRALLYFSIFILLYTKKAALFNISAFSFL